jgi:hypothetical protein
MLYRCRPGSAWDWQIKILAKKGTGTGVPRRGPVGAPEIDRTYQYSQIVPSDLRERATGVL